MRIIAALTLAFLCACEAGYGGMGTVGGGKTYLDLVKDRDSGKTAEYALPPGQVEILARESFTQAGWRVEMRKQNCVGGDCMSLRGNEGGNDGPGSAVLWFEPGATAGTTKVTTVSSTAVSFSVYQGSGLHPLSEGALHLRIAAAVRTYQEKKAAGM